jgi:hypothetical protein
MPWTLSIAVSCAAGFGLTTRSRVPDDASRLELSVIQVAFADSAPLNRPSLLCVLVVERATTPLSGGGQQQEDSNG